MAQWTDGDIQANGLNLHYYRTGGAKPAVVLLHGFTDNGLCWTPVAKELEHDYDLIMPDARGHGQSEGPRRNNDFTTEHLVADVVAIIEALGLGRPALIGHSMGAHTAALVGRDHPALISKLLLEDPPWHDEDYDDMAEEYHQLHMKSWEADIRHIQATPYEQLVTTTQQNNPHWSHETVTTWVTAQQQFNLKVFASGLMATSMDWRTIVTPLTMPTLLITGDPDRGSIVQLEDAQRALTTMQAGELAHIAQAGHSIHRDQFTAFMHAVTQFLHKEE